ncbi:hypothetical protein [Qipengyuania gelatinilytica]|uniref:Uncharacterized protein n=1 Tax=Qipengyuania gelatinilytica TaxID=2867231 RepID=A0ABX9A6Y8_9SPHN|nr:hypothetical protein [Qipengyuania gelatinilytica]QZD95557.1 hypothetical protein K3136_02180 [Qipengyuania gelatinilytica]
MAPQLLAFPHSVETEIGTIHSEKPLDAAMVRESVQSVQARMSTTPLASTSESRPIFITDGGWRWHWLAVSSSGSLAITRPLNTAVVVNKADPESGKIASIGGERTLGSVLAHEFTHGLIRRRFGILRSMAFPQWKVEGYCDYVAGESTLSDEQAAALKSSGTDSPALVYFHGRRRVAEILAQNGGSVDQLFNTED